MWITTKIIVHLLILVSSCGYIGREQTTLTLKSKMFKVVKTTWFLGNGAGWESCTAFSKSPKVAFAEARKGWASKEAIHTSGGNTSGTPIMGETKIYLNGKLIKTYY